MRRAALALILAGAVAASGAELESRVLTHYVPQDLLETAVRTEGWTEIPLKVKGGTRKGDRVRVWTGGSIDRGNGDQPSENVAGPVGLPPAADMPKLALSTNPGHTYALLFKTDTPGVLHGAPPAGKPLEIPLTRDKERLWIGFNDEHGRYNDNHLGKGRRHELDPLWVRIEVVRTIVD
jgi:hypothetical protein